MKAKEYFDKYHEAVIKEARSSTLNGTGAMNQMFLDFKNELLEIAESRKIKLQRSFLAVIEEQNRKWNAVAAMFVQKYGVPVLKRNAFSKVILGMLEEQEK